MKTIAGRTIEISMLLLFSVMMAHVQAGPVHLSWNTPTTDEDGTALTDLGGYRLHYGQSSGRYTAVVDVGNQTTYILNGLAAGVYYFSVTAYDTSGNESDDSNEASTTVLPDSPTPPPPTPGTIPQAQLSVADVDSEEVRGEDGAADNSIDGQTPTIWHTEWLTRTPPPPHSIVIGLGGAYQVTGFSYLPRQDGTPNGTVAQYEFYVSQDGVNWGSPVATGRFANDQSQKSVTFAGKAGRFVSFVALSEVNGNPWTSAAELRITGTSAP